MHKLTKLDLIDISKIDKDFNLNINDKMLTKLDIIDILEQKKQGKLIIKSYGNLSKLDLMDIIKKSNNNLEIIISE